MTKEEYNNICDKVMPKESHLKRYVISFFIGGLMGFVAELLTNIFINYFYLSYNDSISLMLIIVIFITSILTGLGVFDNLVEICGAGLFIPITGFAHSTTSSALEYRKEGFIFGIGSNIFKLSGSVILYAVVSSFFFGLIRYLLLEI